MGVIMSTLEEKRMAWFNAVREHKDAVKLSRDTGEPIPNLLALLGALNTTRRAYFSEYLDVDKREDEEWRKRFVVAYAPMRVEASSSEEDSTG